MIRQVDTSNSDYISLLTQGQQKSGSAGQVDEVSLILGSGQDSNSDADSVFGTYNDQVELSPQALQMLQEYQQANQVDTATTTIAGSASADRVAYLKQLIQGGGTADYLNSIDNNTLADSILKHPLAPNFS